VITVVGLILPLDVARLPVPQGSAVCASCNVRHQRLMQLALPTEKETE